MITPLNALRALPCLALLLPAFAAQPNSPLAESANVMLGRRDAAGFLRMGEFDFVTLLPKPPAPGSIVAAADLDTVLQIQASRTPEQIAWAKLVEKDDVFLHREILGAWFEASRLPITAAFFRTLANDLKAMDAAAKIPFQRPRPFDVDTRVQPCVSRPTSTGYPSGSALQAMVWAELLAELIPAQRAALVERAHRAAWGRVLGGVHFPTDVAAGRGLAAPFLEACRRNPEFVARFQAVREEVTRVSKE